MRVGSIYDKANVYLVVLVFSCAIAVTVILHVMRLAVESELFYLPGTIPTAHI